MKRSHLSSIPPCLQCWSRICVPVCKAPVWHLCDPILPQQICSHHWYPRHIRSAVELCQIFREQQAFFLLISALYVSRPSGVWQNLDHVFWPETPARSAWDYCIHSLINSQTTHYIIVLYTYVPPKVNSRNVPPYSFFLTSLILIFPQMASQWMMWMTRPRRLVWTGSSKSPPSESFCPDCILNYWWQQRAPPRSVLISTLWRPWTDMWRQLFLSATASWAKRMHFHSHCFNSSLEKMWSWQMEGGHLQRHTSHWVFLSPPLQWYSGDASSPDSHDQGHRRPSSGGVCQSLPLQGKDTPFSSVYSKILPFFPLPGFFILSLNP